MSKKGGMVTTTNQIDPEMAARMRELWNNAGKAADSAAPGVSPYSTQAAGAYQDMMRKGATGFNALTGDTHALESFMNPFMERVIGDMKTQFGDIAALTQKSVADAATKAGAFGGDRHGIATGTALAEAEKAAQSQIAATMYGGFNDAMGRAGAAANAGFGAAGALDEAGRYSRGVALENDPAYRRFMLQKRASEGMPYGTSTTQPWQRNVGAGALGGALQGAEMGSQWGPWGTFLGGVGGGILGSF
jgi:hypothetical protein